MGDLKNILKNNVMQRTLVMIHWSCCTFELKKLTIVLTLKEKDRSYNGPNKLEGNRIQYNTSYPFDYLFLIEI